MTLDSTHPARKFEGVFRFKKWASPAMPVPTSHTDTLNLIKLLTGGKAKLTLTVGVEYGSGIRLDGELRSGGSTYTLYGSFIDPARPSDAAGTLVILNPRQQVRFRASLKDNRLTFTPAFDDGTDHWVQDFYFARQTGASAPPAAAAAPRPAVSRAPAPPPAPRDVPAALPESPDEVMVKQWTNTLASTALVYKTNMVDSDYSGGSIYYDRQIVIRLMTRNVFELDDQSFSRISSSGLTLPRSSRRLKTGFWSIAVSTKDQPLLVLKPTGEDEMLYVISERDRTLHLDGKPFDRAKL